MVSLVSIPVVDVRAGGPVRHASEGRARARALSEDCLTWLPRPVRWALPAMDAVSRRWLVRSRSPYAPEVAAIAEALGFPGIWFLNSSYQWGCTAVARDQDGAPWLARTLDWPFPGLGRHLEVAYMRGAAGEFFNLSPGPAMWEY
jgi:peptidoglycan/xylan/chitin deacetylase (PgdA/CDA1 family)